MKKIDLGDLAVEVSRVSMIVVGLAGIDRIVIRQILGMGHKAFG